MAMCVGLKCSPGGVVFLTGSGVSDAECSGYKMLKRPKMCKGKVVPELN
jgi:hypothetical protein